LTLGWAPGVLAVSPAMEVKTATPPASHFLTRRRSGRILGVSVEDLIRVFFGGNALVAIVVLGLIMLFLLKEGVGFFGQNWDNLRIYRQAGLEYVDIMRTEVEEHTALNRYLNDIRVQEITRLTQVEGRTPAEAMEALASFDEYSYRFSDAIIPVRGVVSDLSDVAIALKEGYIAQQDLRESREMLLAAGKIEEANQVPVREVDFAAGLQPILDSTPAFLEAHAALGAELRGLLEAMPQLPTPELQERLGRFAELTREYLAGFDATEQRLAAWDYTDPVPAWKAFSGFIFGRDWLTASFWQDWYGIVPLFAGSVMVSLVALTLAVPLGVGAAIYVNQVATPREQRIIKPCIEFIAAIPSVVLGFFGIVVLGETLRQLSQVTWLDWVPGFPFSERLNILTAGSLLALIAVPTIFTLAEDAINNVPRAFKEASFALGANRLQTIVRIIIPAALSGIISAVLLGLGRVIGETMVVLLCAGNRIAIPDFTAGLGVITQPVHTMTGIIAQEMGEVVRGSIHYRALFVVGIALFLLSLGINYAAQKIVRRYRISIG